jgi:hypothetical protein
VQPYPRWQQAISERLAWFAVRHGFDLERSRVWESRLNQLLGMPSTIKRWDHMTLNDKITYRKLRLHDERYQVCSDKLTCRSYVTDRLGASSVAAIIRLGETAEAFADLVGPFVLKANHGSGMKIVVREQRCLTSDELTRASNWLGEDYGYWSREWAYQEIPRRLIAEQLLSDPPPWDYKCFVFDGVVRAVIVDIDRFGTHVRAIMSPQWEFLGNVEIPLTPKLPEQLPGLATILANAAILGAEFDFMRVDQFDLGDRVVVGELTCFPISGNGVFDPPRLDRDLGRFWTTRPTKEPKRKTRLSA